MIDEQLARIEEQLNKTPVKDSMEAMTSRFTKKGWLVDNLYLRTIAHPVSIGMQVISAAFGFYGMKVLMEVIPLPIPYFEYIGAVIGLFLLEFFKRKFSDKFWDSFFAWTKRSTIKKVSGADAGKVSWISALANILILVASIGITVGGAYFVSTDYSPEAKLKGTTSNPEALALIEERNNNTDRIEENKASIESHKANKVKDNGKLVISWPSQKAITKLEASNLALNEANSSIAESLKDQYGILTVQNKKILKDAEVRTNFSRWFIVIGLLFFELIFEAFMAFMSYYDVRLFIAENLANDQQDNSSQHQQTNTKANTVVWKEKANRPTVFDNTQNPVANSVTTGQQPTPTVKNQQSDNSEGQHYFFNRLSPKGNVVSTVKSQQSDNSKPTVLHRGNNYEVKVVNGEPTLTYVGDDDKETQLTLTDVRKRKSVYKGRIAKRKKDGKGPTPKQQDKYQLFCEMESTLKKIKQDL